MGLILRDGRDGIGMVNMHKEVTIPPETVHYLPLGKIKERVQAYMLSSFKGSTDRLIPRSIIKADRSGQLMLSVYNFEKRKYGWHRG